jgi:hypothetical protein
MDAENIIEKLKTTPFKMSYVMDVKDKARKLDKIDLSLLRMDLHRQMKKPQNASLSKPVNEILKELSSLTFDSMFL